MKRFWAVIEFVRPGTAIVTVRDFTGKWAGEGRVEVKSGICGDLYEAGYRYASLAAQSKGGFLDRFWVSNKVECRTLR